MKPLVLDLLGLVERTLSLARDPEAVTSNPGALAQAEEHVRAALELLPFTEAGAEDRDPELENVPPALPSEPAASHHQSAGYEAQFVTEEAPSNEWLLGDDESFDLG